MCLAIPGQVVELTDSVNHIAIHSGMDLALPLELMPSAPVALPRDPASLRGAGSWIAVSGYLMMLVAVGALASHGELFSRALPVLLVQAAALGWMMWARAALGWRSFRIGAEPHGEFVTRGPYGAVRHPSTARSPCSSRPVSRRTPRAFRRSGCCCCASGSAFGSLPRKRCCVAVTRDMRSTWLEPSG